MSVLTDFEDCWSSVSSEKGGSGGEVKPEDVDEFLQYAASQSINIWSQQITTDHTESTLGVKEEIIGCYSGKLYNFLIAIYFTYLNKLGNY